MFTYGERCMYIDVCQRAIEAMYGGSTWREHVERGRNSLRVYPNIYVYVCIRICVYIRIRGERYKCLLHGKRCIYIYVNKPLKLYGESTWREHMERGRNSLRVYPYTYTYIWREV